METDEEIEVKLYDEIAPNYYSDSTPRTSPFSSVVDVRVWSSFQGSMKFTKMPELCLLHNVARPET